VVQLVKADRLRLLAVTGLKRSSAMPDVPTVAESLPGFEAINWFGLMAPAGTPREVVGRLHAETAKALQDAELRQKLAALGVEIQPGAPQEFSALLKSETEKWAKVAKSSGARAE